MAHTSPNDFDRWVNDRLASLAPTPWQPDLQGRLADLHRVRTRTQRRRLRWTGAAVVATAVCVSLPVTRAFGARCVEACVYTTARMSQWWRAEEPAASAPKVVGATLGDLAPDLLGTRASGASLSLASLRGHVVVVNFWATWCGPCLGEIPLLNALQTRLGSQGLDVVGVSLDQEGWPALTSFIDHQAMTYPVVLGSDDIAASYGGVAALPATFVIDRDGVIVAKVEGPIRPGVYDELLQRLLK